MSYTYRPNIVPALITSFSNGEYMWRMGPHANLAAHPPEPTDEELMAWATNPELSPADVRLLYRSVHQEHIAWKVMLANPALPVVMLEDPSLFELVGGL